MLFVIATSIVGLSGCHSSSSTSSSTVQIAALAPTEATVGSAVVISGSGFGTTEAANSSVTFNGKPATPIFWSSSSITVNVPSGATTGSVVVTAGGMASAGSTFTVDSGAASSCMMTSATINTNTLGAEGALRGTYAYSMSGFQGSSPGTRFEKVGSFVANGAGVIGGGHEDFNLGTNGDLQRTVVSGAYALGPDLRGCMTLTYNDTTTATYRFSLGSLGGISAGVASRGNIIEFDDGTGSGSRASGIILEQSTGDFANTLGTNYSFGLQGVNSSGGRVAQAGTFTLAPGTGAITAGYMDYNNAGNMVFSGSGTNGLSSGNLLTNGISSTTGRTTATFVAENACAATCTYNWVIYVINQYQFLVMSTDALGTNTPLVSGRMAAAAKTTYPTDYLNTASTDGYIIEATGATAGAASALLEQIAFTSTNVSGTQWTYASGMGAMSTIASTPYVLSPVGRTSFANNVVLYLANPVATDGIMGFAVTQDLSASEGLLILQQSFAFSSAGNGHYFLGSVNMADANVRNQIGTAGTSPNSAGSSVGIGGATDQNAATASPVLSSSTFATTLTVSSTNGAVTGSDGNGGQIVGIANGNSVYYIDEAGDATMTVIQQ